MTHTRLAKRWLTFGLDAEREERFRQAQLDSGIAQARTAIRLVLVPLVGFALNDYRFFGFPWPFGAVQAVRLALLLHTVLLLRRLRGLTGWRAYDRAEFTWGLFVALFTVALAATRPHAFLGHSTVAVVAVFLTMLVVPNRSANQLLLSLVYTVGETAV
jgi:hypothetical protein